VKIAKTVYTVLRFRENAALSNVDRQLKAKFQQCLCDNGRYRTQTECDFPEKNAKMQNPRHTRCPPNSMAASRKGAQIGFSNSELTRIIQVWQHLPQEFRQAILAIVDAVK
jgi:hypothetical protein